MAVLPRIVPWLFERIGGRASEPEIKFIFLVLFVLGGLANLGKSEAVLIGMALAPFFLKQKELPRLSQPCCNGRRGLPARRAGRSSHCHCAGSE